MTLLEDLVAKSVLHWSDYLILVLYFVAVIAVGIWSSCLNRGSVGGYFLAGRNMNWVLVGASLFASNIGSGHFIGLAGSGAASGIAIGVFELNAIFIVMLLAWVFVPVYITSGVYTMPEYLRKRFGGDRIRIYLAVLAVLLYVFTKVSADLYAGAIFIKQSIGWDIWGSIIALLILSMIFTVGGGLSAVIWTDFVQVIIMIIGALVLMGISFAQVGGFNALEEKFLGPDAWSNFTKAYLNHSANLTDSSYNYAMCGKTDSTAFHFMHSATDKALPWPGVLFGLTISSVWYWCSDQVIVQRALAAKNMSHVKAGALLAGFLKILPLFLMVLPGMISRVLFPDLVGCSEPNACMEICGNRAGCTNIAYPLLVVKLMPHGARGLMLAVMMSALMSSLTSIFNSGSTIFTMDIWRRIRKNATDMELMIIGRLFVVGIVAVSIAWIPVIQNISELFHYIQGITAFLAPPVCAVYVLAISWKRINEQGAFWGLMTGLVIGLIRFVWEFSYGPPPPCGETDTRHPAIASVHYLHFGIILFAIVFAVTIVISLLTKPLDDCHLRRLTFPSRFEKGERIDVNRLNELQANGSLDGSGMALTDLNKLPGSCNDESDIPVKVLNVRRRPWYLKMLLYVCGIENMSSDSRTPEAQEMTEEEMSIYEDPFWASVVNTLAVVLMIGAAFMWGYYA